MVRELLKNGLIIHEDERIAPAVVLATILVMTLFALGFIYQILSFLGV